MSSLKLRRELEKLDVLFYEDPVAPDLLGD